MTKLKGDACPPSFWRVIPACPESENPWIPDKTFGDDKNNYLSSSDESTILNKFFKILQSYQLLV